MGDSGESSKKGLEGTGLDLPSNKHGNLKSASSDENLRDILLHIKSSKTPVSKHPFLLFSFLFLNFSILMDCVNFHNIECFISNALEY